MVTLLTRCTLLGTSRAPPLALLPAQNLQLLLWLAYFTCVCYVFYYWPGTCFCWSITASHTISITIRHAHRCHISCHSPYTVDLVIVNCTIARPPLPSRILKYPHTSDHQPITDLQCQLVLLQHSSLYTHTIQQCLAFAKSKLFEGHYTYFRVFTDLLVNTNEALSFTCT